MRASPRTWRRPRARSPAIPIATRSWRTSSRRSPTSASVAWACARDPFTLHQLQPALDEIGTVQVPGAGSPGDQSAGGASRPIEQISEGAWISGVCLGLARYLGIDATLLRVIAFILLLISGGSIVLVYVVLMLLLPFAPLDPARGTVGTIPLKARQLVQYAARQARRPGLRAGLRRRAAVDAELRQVLAVDTRLISISLES